jgi:hypothetical protein
VDVCRLVAAGVVDHRAELSQLGTACVGFLLGPFCSGTQFGTDFLALTRSLVAELGQHALSVRPGPFGLGSRGGLGCLCPGGVLVCALGCGVRFGCHLAGLGCLGLSGAHSLVGVGADLLHRGVALRFRSRDSRGGVPAGLLDRGITVSFRSRNARYGFLARFFDRRVSLRFRGRDTRGSVPAGLLDRGVALGLRLRLGGLGLGLGRLSLRLALLGSGQLLSHLLGGSIGLGTLPVSLGGALLGRGCPRLGGSGALLGCCPDRFDLDLDSSRVGHCGDSLLEPLNDSGYPVSLCSKCPQ